MTGPRAGGARGTGALPLSSLVLEALGPPAKAPPELKARILDMDRLMRGAMHAVIKPGTLIAGKYRVLSLVGKGAMGSVWAAVNEAIGGEVALKVILCPEPERSYRLLREARALGALQHRNIVDIYDIDQTETGAPFLVMPLLTGETVADLLDRKRLVDAPIAARIGRDVARALAAAHAVPIVHRDLKPANIFLHEEPDEGTIVKVLDFGLAKNLAVLDPFFTPSGGAVGSLLYMSPEQVRAPDDVDHRADIWAIGIFLFELLTGHHPFEGSAHEVVMSILDGEIPRVDKLACHVDPGLVDVVARCMRRAQEERFQSAAEVAEALDRYASTDAGASAQGPMKAATDRVQAPATTPQPNAGVPRAAAPQGPGVGAPHEVRAPATSIPAADIHPGAPLPQAPGVESTATSLARTQGGVGDGAPAFASLGELLTDLRLQARVIAVIAAAVSGIVLTGATLLSPPRQGEHVTAELAAPVPVREPSVTPAALTPASTLTSPAALRESSSAGPASGGTPAATPWSSQGDRTLPGDWPPEAARRPATRQSLRAPEAVRSPAAGAQRRVPHPCTDKTAFLLTICLRKGGTP